MQKPHLSKLSKKQVIIVGVAFAVPVLALAGWRVYADQQVRRVSSYQECKETPGSAILLSYPAVCMTKDKKRFPNPDQKAPTLPEVNKATDLRISEWGVVISVPDQGATYTMNGDGTAYITTVELENLLRQIQGCTAGLHGITVDRNLKEVVLYEAACVTADSPGAERILNIQQDIRNALKAPGTL